MTGRVGKKTVIGPGLTKTSRREAVTACGEGGHEVGAVVWAGGRRRRFVVQVAITDHGSDGCQPRPAHVDRKEGGRLQGPVHQGVQGAIVGPVRDRRCRSAGRRQLQRHCGALVNDVLVDEGIGKASKAVMRAGNSYRRLCPVSDDVDDAVTQLGGIPVSHARTPTRTSRNRQGTAG